MAGAFGVNMIYTLLLGVLVFFALTAAAPAPSIWGGPEAASDDSPTSAAKRLRSQYNFPKEILAVLSIIGGDIIQKACAQEAGTFPITPVAFSFGWVAYAFSALMSAFSDGSLMPEADINSVVIGVDRGHWRQNESWVLGRLIRDLELENQRGPRGLGVYFYKTSGLYGKPTRSFFDWLIFLLVIGLQFTLAILPIIYDSRNWSILYITGGGTLLAFASGSLPSWKSEKYNTRDEELEEETNQGREKNTKKKKKEPMRKAAVGRKFALTRGNGHGHVFVIEIAGENQIIPLDILATIPRASPEVGWNRLFISTLALCWIILLIAVGGMEKDTWMLLLIGGVGMLQNVWVAGRPRNSKEHGIPLTPDGVVKRSSDSEAVLHDAEMRLPGLGLALLDFFFPAGAFHDHHWNEIRKSRDESRAADEERKAADKKRKAADEERKAPDEKRKAADEELNNQNPDAKKAQNQTSVDWKNDHHPKDKLIFRNKSGRFLFHMEPERQPTPRVPAHAPPHTPDAHRNDS